MPLGKKMLFRNRKKLKTWRGPLLCKHYIVASKNLTPFMKSEIRHFTQRTRRYPIEKSLILHEHNLWYLHINFKI